MKRNEPSPWTDERKIVLCEIYPLGSLQWNADELNKRTGSNFTRGAIAGAAARFGLAAAHPKRIDESIARAANKNKRKRTRSDSALGVKLRFAQLPKDIGSLAEYEARGAPKHFIGIPFIDLANNHCRYPYDVDGVTLFCGQPKLETSSYCAGCHPMCWHPVTRRAKDAPIPSWKSAA